MFVTNVEDVPGKRIVTCYGVVSGSTAGAVAITRIEDRSQQLSPFGRD